MLDALIVLDLDAKIRTVNKATCGLLAYSEEELIGMPVGTIFAVLEETLLKATEMDKLIKEEGLMACETDFEAKDGRKIPVLLSSSVMKDEDGKVICIVCTARDITERKQAEETLRESEEKYRAIVDVAGKAGEVIIVVQDTEDTQGAIVFVNEEFPTVLGYSQEELLGKPFSNFVSPDSLATVEERYRRRQKGEDVPSHYEVTALHKDGTAVPIEVAAGTMNYQGKLATVVYWRDMTDRKRAEEALQKSEKRYKFLYENSPSVNLIIDIDGKVKDINSPMIEKVGYAKDEIIDKPALDFIAPEDREEVAALLERSFRGEYTPETEIDIYGKDGAIHTVLFSPGQAPLYEEGQLTGILITGIDITERKKMEVELSGSEERLRILFECAPDAYHLTDLEGKFVDGNKAAEELSGYKRGELIGKSFLEAGLLPPDDLPRAAASLAKNAAGQPTGPEEYTLIRKDGSLVQIEARAFPVEIEGQHLVLAIDRDITERKQAEEKEKQLQQELNLSSRLASIGQMASGVAHEINNPLTSVVGFSQLLLRRDLPEDIRKRLETINSEAQRVARIVENLLTFARRRKPGREYMDINEAVSQTLELRSYEMRANNIQVVTKLSPELPRTVADPGQLQQVFLNIILNAEKAMKDEHGRGTLVVKTKRIGNIIRTSFTDDGPGISKENLDNIFDPFFTTREVGHGTGLGLSVCYGIVAQHKGKLYAQSELGKGATFFVELPIVSKREQQNDTEGSHEETPPQSGAKILVVDDELSVLDFLSSLLTEEGFHVETTDRANVALEKLKRQKYDLLLLDIKMPGMSGIELYHHIKAIDPALAQRVLFITGDIIEPDTTDFLKRTKAPYITKPLKIERLTEEINRILSRNQQ